MNLQEAMQIENSFYEKQTPTEEEVFAYTEAMGLLIRETKDPGYMMELGGWYYAERNFDLALKYYEMAEEYHYPEAALCLGYIWYYGRTGTCDYQKAFHYYSRSMKDGNLQAAYKVADMYKNGYYVDQDEERYRAIIEDLYPKVQRAGYLGDPLPEIFTRLARIRMEQQRYDEAEDLLVQAKDFLAQRIARDAFFGNLTIMKGLVEDQYRLPRQPDPLDYDLYDLFVTLQKPARVRFRYRDTIHQIESLMEDGECVIRYEGKWFRNIDDFFAGAMLQGRLLTGMYQELYGWEVSEA